VKKTKRLIRAVLSAALLAVVAGGVPKSTRAEANIFNEAISEAAPQLLGAMGCEEITLSRWSQWDNYECRLVKPPLTNGMVTASVHRNVTILNVSLFIVESPSNRAALQVAELALRRLLAFLHVADPEPVVRAYFSWPAAENRKQRSVMRVPGYDVMLELDLGRVGTRYISICKSGCWGNAKLTD
jgi:hypothetical protein